MDRGAHKTGLDWAAEETAQRVFAALGRGAPVEYLPQLTARIEELFGAGGALAHDPLSAHPYPTPARDAAVSREHVETVMLAGDWHGNVSWAREQVEDAASQGVQIILQLGDFGIWPGSAGTRFLDELSATARRLGVSVCFLDGNHEDFDQLGRYPVLRDGPAAGLRPVRSRIFHLPRGTRWMWGGLRWCAVGGATSVDRAGRTLGVSWWPQEELSFADLDRIAADAEELGGVDVLATHDAPVAEAIPGLGAFTWGHSELLRAQSHQDRIRMVLERLDPSHCFHGHFHLGYTQVLPLGPQGAPVRVQGLAHDAPGGGTSSIIVRLSELAAAHEVLRG